MFIILIVYIPKAKIECKEKEVIVMRRVDYVIIALGVLLWGGVALNLLLGFQPAVVTSGSMSPTIKAGDAIIMLPVEMGEVGVGDVIIFDAGKEFSITHRVVGVIEEDGSRRFITKGDANTDVDSWDTTEGDILGKEVAVLPKAGYVLKPLTSVRGKLLVVLGACVIIYLALRRKGRVEF